MTDSQTRMITGGLVTVAGATIFAGGMSDTVPPLDENSLGIPIILFGLAMVILEYIRSWQRDRVRR